MNDFVKLPIVGALLAITLIFALSGCGYIDRNGNQDDVADFATLFEVHDILRTEHFNRSNLDTQTLSQGAIRGLIEALDDPHAAYIPPELFSVETDRFKGSFQGIGAEVSMKDGQLVITAPIPDNPAEKAGIRKGDIILEVDGQSTKGLGVYEAVAMIRGPKGTPVDLLVLHRNATTPVVITVVRDVIKQPSLNIRILTGGIAHLELTSFSETTNAELISALETVHKFQSRGLIIDVRQNVGGLVSATVDVTSQFLDSGLVFYQIDGSGRRTNYRVREGGLALDIPIVLLMDEFSASGSEILAGALRDHDRATLVGSKTFGKGSVNVQHALSDGSGMYYTIARWYTPSGDVIEGHGLLPDIEVLEDPEGAEDFQLDKAIEILTYGDLQGG
ncbi:S41 family peptidase [SAR202 cluster bacterium AC-409-J13_OGT_754m]|nr:S41 family peptidase [SAR202 cluster bacterium AC-409-J13_OGT_754m]